MNVGTVPKEYPSHRKGRGTKTGTGTVNESGHRTPVLIVPRLKFVSGILRKTQRYKGERGESKDTLLVLSVWKSRFLSLFAHSSPRDRISSRWVRWGRVQPVGVGWTSGHSLGSTVVVSEICQTPVYFLCIPIYRGPKTLIMGLNTQSSIDHVTFTPESNKLVLPSILKKS